MAVLACGSGSDDSPMRQPPPLNKPLWRVCA
jgi:hypothetical protein